MLTFDSDEEQTAVLTFLDTNTTVPVDAMGKKFTIYLGATAKIPADPNGFVWYKSGDATSKTVKLNWNSAEPNNGNNGTEFCTQLYVKSGFTLLGINDCQCNLLGMKVNYTVVCQKTFNVTSNGLNPKYH